MEINVYELARGILKADAGDITRVGPAIILAIDADLMERHQTSAGPLVLNRYADWFRDLAFELDRSAEGRGGAEAEYRRWRAGYAQCPPHEPGCPVGDLGGSIPLVGCVACEYLAGEFL